MAVRVPIGAPGIYADTGTPLRRLTGERMDVCAFVGVAPRGPARIRAWDPLWPSGEPLREDTTERRRSVAVPVESFQEYRRLYGGFEGPGRLPYAVAAFFEQGGRRAYVVRIVHEYEDEAANAAGTARGTLGGVRLGRGAVPITGSLELEARHEGRWGNALRAAMAWSLTVLPVDAGESTREALALPEEHGIPVGTLLRVALPGGGQVLRLVTDVRSVGRSNASGRVQRAALDLPLSAPPDAVEAVEGILAVDDGNGRVERHEHLGLSPAHPRWMAAALCRESELVWPGSAWAGNSVLPANVEDPPTEPSLEEAGQEQFQQGEDRYGDITHLPANVEDPPTEPSLEEAGQGQFQQGKDRYGDITHEDFFDDSWEPGNPDPGAGVHSLTHLCDLSSVVVPDLYVPEPLPPTESVLDERSLAGPTFEPCLRAGPAVSEEQPKDVPLSRLHLDPRERSDLDDIVALQSRLVDLAEELKSLVVLLDVPPGLGHYQILKWRSHFQSSYVAAYHPWLRAARRDDRRERLVSINPSAVAAGIIAHQEELFGVPHGPANVLAEGVVDVAERVTPAQHDQLHPLGINVFVVEPDGIRLTAGRTLSRRADLRQLSVRRLMIMLCRALERQMQWAVFEPNTASLRADIQGMVRTYLSRLHRAGAFQGATEDEAYFVRCDESINTRLVVDAGKLIAEIGVAPAEPTEFIVLHLCRDTQGTLFVEE